MTSADGAALASAQAEFPGVITLLGKDAPHADVYAVQRSTDTAAVAQEFVRLAAASTGG